MTPRRIWQWEIVGLVALIGLAAFFRLDRLPEVLHWRGDEGRDALVMRQMLQTGRPVLIGPPASIITAAGSLYLGPLTYYLMAVGLGLANFSPLGPAVVVVICSLATVWLLWIVGRQWFHPIVGWIAASWYALSSTAIIFGRHGWNPNFSPFFALLTMYAAWRAGPRQQSWWWVVVAAGLAGAVQSHATGWVLVPIVVGLWFIAWRKHRKSPTIGQRFWLASVVSWAVFLAIMSPLMIYDLSHQGHNWRVIGDFLRQPIFHAGSGWLAMPQNFLRQLSLVVQDTLTGPHAIRSWILIVVMIVAGIFMRPKVSRPEGQAWRLMVIWLGTGLIALALFPGYVFIQYREFLWPAVFLLMGWFFWRLAQPWERSRWLWAVGSLLIGLVVVVKLLLNSTTEPVIDDYLATQRAAELIGQAAGQQTFSLAMISDRGNTDQAYRYELALHHRQPVPVSQAEQAFIVCEGGPCMNVPMAILEQQSFSQAELAHTWHLTSTVTLFELVPAETNIVHTL